MNAELEPWERWGGECRRFEMDEKTGKALEDVLWGLRYDRLNKNEELEGLELKLAKRFDDNIRPQLYGRI